MADKQTPSLRAIIYEVLCNEQALRSARGKTEFDPIDKLPVPEWVLAERRAVLAKLNERQVENGQPLIDEETLVMKAERLAMGHVDYTSKFALYAAELTRSQSTGARLPGR